MGGLINKRVVVGFLVAVFVIVSLASPEIAQASSDAVLILHFDEGSGTIAKDESGHGNDGTIHGATWTTGVSGKALQFDGVDDYVSVTSSPSLDITDAITIEAWVKPNGLTGVKGLVSKRNTNTPVTYFFFQRDNKLEFGYYGIDSTWRSYYSNTGLTTNWQQVAVIFSPSTNKLYYYRNGASFGSSNTISSWRSYPALPVIIGWDPAYDFFSGTIDEVAIYNRALSPEEIKAHYLAKRAGYSITPTPPSSPSKMENGREYYRDITLNENSDKNLRDYQVLVEFDPSNFPEEAKEDGADTRFTDAEGKELSYWIESWDYSGKSGKIWVKVPRIPANGETKITMRYGNPSASSQSNGDATFELFDDFESYTVGDIDGQDAWSRQTSYGFCDVSTIIAKEEKSLRVYDDTSSGFPHVTKNIQLHTSSFVIEFDYYPYAFSPYYIGGHHVGVREDTGPISYTPFTIHWRKDLGLHYSNTGSQYIPVASNVFTKGAWNKITYKVIDFQNLDIYVDNKYIGRAHEAGAATKISYVTFGSTGTSPAGDEYYIDNIRVRKYASSEPTITVEAEQPSSIITFEPAKTAIEEAKNKISEAISRGSDLTQAELLLEEAEQALEDGDYSKATELAGLAKKKAEMVMMASKVLTATVIAVVIFIVVSVVRILRKK